MSDSPAAETTHVDSHIEELRSRAEDPALTTLKTRVDALESQLREQPKPARITAKTLTVIGSVIAAVIPLTTAIDGYLKWRADLALAAQQQLHTARMDSLKTVLSAQLPELERESRLRLLLAMLEPGDAIHEWAAGELGRVEKNVKQLEDEKAAALQERDAWEQKAADAAAKIEAKQGASLADLVRGLSPATSEVVTPAPAAPITAKPALSRQRPGAESQLKLPPEALEYQNAKRMSEVAEGKVNARTRRLQGLDLF